MKEKVRAVLAAALVALCLAGLAGLVGCAGSKGKSGAAALAGKPGGETLAAGDAALAHGDPRDAGKLYLAALKAGAAPVVVHTRMGDLYLRVGDYPKAVMAYRAALAADPKYAPALQGLGFALYFGGAGDEAAKTLAQALELSPSLSRAAALLGAIEAREGRPEAALAVYDKSLAIAFDPDVENNRGIALMRLGRNEDAVAAFAKAGAAKKSPKIANNLGLALCKLGRYDDAYAAFASVAGEATALNNVGVCYMEAGNKAKAQEYFERAIAANPKFYPVAHDNLSRLSTAEELALPSSAPAQPVAGQPAAVPAPARPLSSSPAAQSAPGRAASAERLDRLEMP
ncbi:tetratricopeptide repeat protein [Solidesulfovibrio sp. C21]|uniref:tetratricopeptide repeat protein n=1 Tax=Solidesulfovibrio sp. C21 TaxID=3398613 RepID=UPI0039FD10FF